MRPAWRGFDEELIGEHKDLSQWFVEKTTYEVVDTTHLSPDEVARRISEFAASL